MRSFILSPACLLALFTASSAALRAVPSQQCASACGDVTKTNSSEIVCSDADIQNTPKGQALRNCLNCQQNSTANDPNTGESDIRWFLYNLRFVMSTCLWGYPGNTSALSTPCITNPACGLYQSNMEYDSLLPNASTYDYCGGFDALANVQQPRCIACLQQLGDDFYISNYFIALVAGCQQKPNPGSLLSLQGTLFSTSPITITTPTPSATAIPPSQSPSGLALGAIVGAVVGGLVVLLTVTGCCIIWWGKRRRRAQLQALAGYHGYDSSPPLGGHVEPKWGLNAPEGWSQDETPTTAGGYGCDKQSFSPYVSQYTSPVSARDMLNPKQIWDAHQPDAMTMQASAGIKDEAYELEKMRDQRMEERKMQEQQLRDAFLQDAAERGFTTAPIIRMPSMARDMRQ